VQCIKNCSASKLIIVYIVKAKFELEVYLKIKNIKYLIPIEKTQATIFFFYFYSVANKKKSCEKLYCWKIKI